MPKYSVLVRVKGQWVNRSGVAGPHIVECTPDYGSASGALHRAGYVNVAYCDEFKALKNGALIFGGSDFSRSFQVYKLIPLEIGSGLI